MAGGGGTRLWPLSTEARPKQFLPLLSDRSLLAETYARVRPLSRGRLGRHLGTPCPSRRRRASGRAGRPHPGRARPAQLGARDPRGGRSVFGRRGPRHRDGADRPDRPRRRGVPPRRCPRPKKRLDGAAVVILAVPPTPPRDGFRIRRSAGRRGAALRREAGPRQRAGARRLGPPPLERRHFRLPALASARRGASRGGGAPRRRRALRRDRRPGRLRERFPTSRSTSPSWRKPRACAPCRSTRAGATSAPGARSAICAAPRRTGNLVLSDVPVLAPGVRDTAIVVGRGGPSRAAVRARSELKRRRGAPSAPSSRTRSLRRPMNDSDDRRPFAAARERGPGLPRRGPRRRPAC